MPQVTALRRRSPGWGVLLSLLSFAGPVATVWWYTVGQTLPPESPLSLRLETLWLVSLAASLGLGLAGAYFSDGRWAILGYVPAILGATSLSLLCLFALGFYPDEFGWAGPTPFPFFVLVMLALLWLPLVMWRLKRRKPALLIAWISFAWAVLNGVAAFA